MNGRVDGWMGGWPAFARYGAAAFAGRRLVKWLARLRQLRRGGLR